MKSIDYYEDLADILSAERIKSEFADVLAAKPVHGNDIADALFALSERQWNTYELADQKLRVAVSDKIKQIWDGRNTVRAEALIGVIGFLGLGDTFRHLLSLPKSMMSDEVRLQLDEASKDFGDTVDDPYSGMRQ